MRHVVGSVVQKSGICCSAQVRQDGATSPGVKAAQETSGSHL
jgi:hypothetical protein